MARILLVEDNDDLRDMIAEVLRQEGYLVTEAENGQVALECIEEMQSPPHLLLLDLMMPVMDGAQLLEALYGANRLTSLPVIVLSAGGRAADVPRADCFMKKPFDPARLLELVREYCSASD